MVDLAWIGFGVALLWLGSHILLLAVRDIARRSGLSDFLIGLTVVSIATSLPEIFVALTAQSADADTAAVGNIVGSCFVQITLLLGIVAALTGPLPAAGIHLRRDGFMLCLGPLALVLAGLNGQITPFAGTALALAYCAYLGIIWMHSDGERSQRFGPPTDQRHALYSVAGLVFGAIFIWQGADLIVSSGLTLAQRLDMSETILGLWAGLATSLPELAISLTAALRGNGGVSLGNLLGSNITDPFFSLGVSALAAGGLSVNATLLYTAVPLWVIGTLTVLGILAARSEVSRPGGFLLCIGYLTAMVVLQQ